MPPCSILKDCAEVPAPKSSRSTSATLSPRNAASQAAHAAPMPPPMTSTSKLRSASASRDAARVVLLSAAAAIIDDLPGCGCESEFNGLHTGGRDLLAEQTVLLAIKQKARAERERES